MSRDGVGTFSLRIFYLFHFVDYRFLCDLLRLSLVSSPSFYCPWLGVEFVLSCLPGTVGPSVGLCVYRLPLHLCSCRLCVPIFGCLVSCRVHLCAARPSRFFEPFFFCMGGVHCVALVGMSVVDGYCFSGLLCARVIGEYVPLLLSLSFYTILVLVLWIPLVVRYRCTGGGGVQ